MISGEIIPSMLNVGRMISSAYNGWLDPETTYITGVAPSPSKIKNAAGLVRSAKQASKLSGKTFTPTMRNAQGKRSSNLGAITANDMYNEGRIISGLGILKATGPFKSNGPTQNSIIRAANDYIKENKLLTVTGPNGKTYVKMPNGNVRSMEAVGKDYIAERGWY